MAFPASTVRLSWVVQRIAEEMSGIKSAAQTIRSNSASRALTAEEIVTYCERMVDAASRMAALASAPGLTEYARSELNSPTLDIVAEYTATVAQINATRDWIVANFPKDGSGNALAFKIGADGRRTQNTFSTASLAPFRTVLDALIATIN